MLNPARPPMHHHMNLHNEPFQKIATQQKTIELRLNDEKRQRIHVGDTITFTSTTDTTQQVHCIVRQLHHFQHFIELYASLPLEKCGYSLDEVSNAHPTDMLAYYTLEQQDQYGVVGIELQVISK